ncbi:MAG: ribosomal L7Ae/L30e/S12e/Gadd45 family protein, partial [Streptococcaceae bacterium]|nr:ribosomal L7Ae/L30e/S12e/Gadd45 family protein [Streptococcaceae bacterium]
MTSREKLLNLLGLAMRAKKLSSGEAIVLEEIRRQKAKLVFVANDAS